MSFEECGITHKRLDDMLIASLRFQMREREELFAKLEELRNKCQEYIAGPAFAIFYWDTGLEGGECGARKVLTQRLVSR